MNICTKFPKELICPICKTNKSKKTAMIPDMSTVEGNIAEAIFFHVDCINLMYKEIDGIKFLFQQLD